MVLLAWAVALPVGAAEPDRSAEALDWTIGTWEGQRRDGAGGEGAPLRLRVEAVLGGAGLAEHLEVTHEGGVYRGFSVSVYTGDDGLWLRRYTSAGRGGFAHLEGTVAGDRSTWRSVTPGRSRESRLTSERVGPGRWKRTQHISEDGGETWRVLWQDELERLPGEKEDGEAGADAGAEEASGVPRPPGHGADMGAGHGPQAHRSPYAHQEDSGIAGLPRSEREQLEAGAGMGLARAAELNSHPGPKHVLELADEIDLSPRQHDAVREIFARMEEAARTLGAEILEKERLLDRRFEHRHLDEPTLRELTAAIAALYGELRFVHLRAHLETVEVLTPEQVAAYDRLRGYTPPGG